MTIIGNRTTSVYFVWARNANGNYSFLRSKKKKKAPNKNACEIHASFEISISSPLPSQTSIRIRETGFYSL